MIALGPDYRSIAYKAVRRAKSRGILPQYPQFCCACGEPGHRTARGHWSIEYHHHDLRQPLNVSAVCHRCHLLIHEGQIPEPATGQLREDTRGKQRQRRLQRPTPTVFCGSALVAE